MIESDELNEDLEAYDPLTEGLLDILRQNLHLVLKDVQRK